MKKLNLKDIEVLKWINVGGDFQIPEGKVVAVHAFQMLCPGCVLHGVPQSQRLHSLFSPERVAVLGLHTVFEHHEAMREPSLRAFLHEFRVGFPVGIDAPSESNLPKTMQKFHLQGTPSWLLFDRDGNLKLQVFGQIEDLILGAEIARLALDKMPENTNLYRREKEKVFDET